MRANVCNAILKMSKTVAIGFILAQKILTKTKFDPNKKSYSPVQATNIQLATAKLSI